MSSFSRLRSSLLVVAATLFVSSFLVSAPGLVGQLAAQDLADEVLSAVRPDFGDFYSPVATEYEVVGSIPVSMTVSQFNDLSVRTELVEDRLLAVEVYLAAYLTDKYTGIFENFDYGNFKSTVRHETMVILGVEPGTQAGSYVASFSVKVAGPTDLAQQLGLQGTPGDLQVSMPADAKGSDFGFPLNEIRRFDPSTEAGPLETLQVSLTSSPQSPNTYPDYSGFLEDGVLDVTMFLGYDYTEDRVDLWTGLRSMLALYAVDFDIFDVAYAPEADPEIEREVRETMDRYYPNSVTDTTIDLFARLTRDSGPFTRAATFRGQPVRVEVRIFHRNMFGDDLAGLKAAFAREASERDVLIFNGHTGSYYGWYLGPEADAYIAPEEVASFPMSADRSQLIVVSGCQSYSNYSDQFFSNPAKNSANLDVITTVNWIQLSAGERAVNSFLATLTAVDPENSLFGASYGQLLSPANGDPFETDAYWSLTGTEDNSVVHPLADLDTFGQECVNSAQCGSQPANECQRGVCTINVTDAYVCPGGYELIDPIGVWGAYCAPAVCPQFVFDDGQIYVDQQYLPNTCDTDLTCPGMWFYGPNKYDTAVCSDNEWKPLGDVTGPVDDLCPTGVFGDGFMYNSSNQYVANSCGNPGQACGAVYFYELSRRETAVCSDLGQWALDGEDPVDPVDPPDPTEPEACPNSVFENGFMYDSELNYVENTCAQEGQSCAQLYFHEAQGFRDGQCSSGQWVF